VLDLAEEGREVRRERVDQMRDLARLGVGLQQRAVLLDARQAETRQPVVEPRADHLLLFLAEMDAALVVNQLAQELEIGVSDLHGWTVGRGLSRVIGLIHTNLEKVNRSKVTFAANAPLD
jgi:hypothetical protein